MNEARIVAACMRLPFRECNRVYGVSQKAWTHVRQHGELPSDSRGRPTDTVLTDRILQLAKEHPEYSYVRVALETGCSKMKVLKVFDENKLNLFWQRLRYADIDLKELDPDLVKARQNPIKTDGPGALIHFDAKRYGALKGGKAEGKLVVGCLVVDNYSAFCTCYLYPGGAKTGEGSAAGLNHFKSMFPCEMKRIYSDNGTEFKNKDLTKWKDDEHVDQRFTKIAHAWSNGKAEVHNRMWKREIMVPLLMEREWDNLEDLQIRITERTFWWNHERPHFGRINRGLPPYIVATECDGLNEEQREERMKELRHQLRYRNRREWEKLEVKK